MTKHDVCPPWRREKRKNKDCDSRSSSSGARTSSTPRSSTWRLSPTAKANAWTPSRRVAAAVVATRGAEMLNRAREYQKQRNKRLRCAGSIACVVALVANRGGRGGVRGGCLMTDTRFFEENNFRNKRRNRG